MKKSIAFAIVAALSMFAVPAYANGTGNTNLSTGGLINVSPSIQTGAIKLLSGQGNGILNNSGVLSGNNTGVGVLGTGLLNSVTSIVTKKKR